jgi:undecaprenyl-diphosphatase
MSFRSVLELDARLSNQMRVAEQPGLLRNISVFFAHSGDSWFWWSGLFLLWIFSEDPFWRKWAVVLAGGTLVLAVIVMSLKFIIRRRRPEGEWGGIYRNTDPHSFPSGHAARAFMIALAASALGPAWAGILLWIWAPLVSLARVAMGVHYVSDVVAGMFVGIVIGIIGLEVYPPIFAWVSSWLWFPLW